MPPHVVITDCDHDTIDPETRELAKAGYDLTLARCRTSAQVVEAGRLADGLITQYAPIDADALAGLERCKVIVRYGVGVETVDLEAAAERGVWVANVPDYGTEEVADHALSLLLALLRGVARLDRAVRAGEWEYSVVRPLRRLSGLTVGLVGLGRIGGALARRLRALEIAVLAHDPAGVPDALRALGVRGAGLPELLRSADAVSLHLPLSPATRHLIDAEALAAMPAHAVLVNTSRGGLVDGGALLAALEAGGLAGAGLDVLESEPPAPGDPLVAHERVIVTPHAAWYSEESYEALKVQAAREVVRTLEEGRPRSPVNEPVVRA